MPRACSTAHRSNRPDHWDGLMLDRSAAGQLSSLSSRTKWQRCQQAIHYVVYLLPAIAAILFYWIRTKVVQQLSNIRPDQWSGLFDWWAVEHAPSITAQLLLLVKFLHRNGIVGFNIPLDTLYTCRSLRRRFYGSWPNQQPHSTEGRWSVNQAQLTQG